MPSEKRNSNYLFHGYLLQFAKEIALQLQVKKLNTSCLWSELCMRINACAL